MENEKVIEAVETETTEETKDQVIDEKVEDKVDFKGIKKELSKQLGLNLFDENNKLNDDMLKGLKTLVDSQKTKEQLEAEQKKAMVDQLEAYKVKEQDWEFKEAAFKLDVDMEKADDIKTLLNAKKQEGQSTSDVLESIVELYPMFKNVKVETESKQVNRLGMSLNNQQVTKKSSLQRKHDEEYGNSPYYKKR